MSTEDYEVRLEAVDAGFTKTLNQAIARIAALEGATPKAAAKIDGLHRSLANLQSPAARSTTAVNSLSGQLEMVRKYGGLTDAEIAKLAKSVSQLQFASNVKLGITQEMRAAEKAAAAARKEIEAANQATARKSQDAAYATYAPNIAATRQIDEQAKALQRFEAGLSNQRYLLYDVASTWGIVSAATLGASTAVVKVAADYEAAGASVQRTSQTVGAGFENLFNDLINISTQMPESFENIAGIATLGGQLGVAAQDIAGFTETVTRFSAVTDVSSQKAAEGLGRVAQLTNTSAAQYENLSSAIYEVGVNSVATESAILSTATQIATAGDLAGFTQYEIVALAGAFASLGIAPERSRGTIQRVFGSITAVVAAGGEGLEKFAQIAGASASEFAATWQNEPQKAFNMFLAGMQKMQDSGADTNAMLKDLGIGAVRDIQALQALSNNMEVYSQAQDDASRAFADGTSTIGGYAIVADTLSAKFTKLANTLKASMATVGDMGAVKAVVDLLQTLAEGFLKFVNNPAGKAITSVAMAAAAAVGVFAAWRASTALLQASTIGLTQAQRFLSQETTKQNLSGMNLFKTLVQLGVGTKTATAATREYSVAVDGATVSQTRANATLGLGARAMTGAKAAASGLGLVLKGLGKAFLPLALITGAVEGINWLANSLKSNETKVREYSESMSGVAEAMRKDTAIYRETGQAIRVVSAEVKDNKDEVSEWSTPLLLASDAQSTLADKSKDATSEIRDQTVAIGENTRAAMAQSVINDSSFEELWRKNREAIEGTTFSMEEYFAAVMQGEAAVQTYIENTRAASGAAHLQRLAEIEAEAYAQYQATLSASGGDSFAPGVQEAEAAWTAAKEASDKYAASVEVGLAAISRFGPAGTKQAAALQMLAEKFDYTAVVNKAFGLSLNETEDDLDGMGGGAKDASDELKALIDTTYAALGATAGLNSSLYSLAESMGKNGLDFSAETQEGIANLGALQSTVQAMAAASGDDYAAFAARVGSLLTSLQEMGVEAGDGTLYLGDVLANVLGQQYGVNVDANPALSSIAAVIQKAIEAKQALLLLEQPRPAQSVGPIPLLGGKSSGGDPAKAAALQAEIKALQDLLDGLTSSQTNLQDVTKAYQERTAAQDNNTRSQKKNTKATKDAVEELRTLKDYASEVASVFDRAWELQFSVQDAKDNLSDAWRNLREEMKFTPLELEFDFSKTFSDNFTLANARDTVRSQFLDMQDAADAAARAVRDAAQAVMDANAKIGSLTAERNKLLAQIAVSEMYGDTARVEQGRAKLAELNAQISAARNDLSDAEKAKRDAQSDASRVTTGDSAAAIRNRSELQSLAQTHADYVQALMDSGASQKEVDQAVKDATKQFEAQAKALGFSASDISVYSNRLSGLGSTYDTAVKRLEAQNRALEANSTKLKGNSQAAGDNREAWQGVTKAIQDQALAMLAAGVPAAEVEKWLEGQKKKLEEEAKKWGISEGAISDYTDAVSGMITIVSKIPANVTSTVTAKASYSAADLALKEFFAKKKYQADVKAHAKATADISAAQRELNKLKVPNLRIRPTVEDSAAKKVGRLHKLLSEISSLQAQLTTYNVGTDQWRTINNLIKSKASKVASGSYYDGGFTGRGGKHEEAGVVHKGEYVVPKEGVNQSTGLPKPEYMNSLFVPSQAMAQPGSRASSNARSGTQLVELLPTQLAQLAEMVSTTVMLDGDKITRMVNSRNRNASIRGVV